MSADPVVMSWCVVHADWSADYLSDEITEPIMCRWALRVLDGHPSQYCSIVPAELMVLDQDLDLTTRRTVTDLALGFGIEQPAASELTDELMRVIADRERARRAQQIGRVV